MTNLINLGALVSRNQHTLLRPTSWVEGTTLRGIPARVCFRPLPPYAGRHITVSVRGEKQFSFPVTVSSGRAGRGWTDAIDPTTGNGIGVIEHLAAAIVFAGIDNVDAVIDYTQHRAASWWYAFGKCSSLPLLDGTPQKYLAAIRNAGMVPQLAARDWFSVKEPLTFSWKGSRFIITPRRQPGWSLHTINKPRMSEAWWWKDQKRERLVDLYSLEAEDQLEAIVRARPTNGTTADWLAFRLATLGTGRKADFCAMHHLGSHLPLDNQRPYGPEEAINHRQTDVTGDFWYYFGNLQINLVAENASHNAVHQFRQWLMEREDYPFLQV